MTGSAILGSGFIEENGLGSDYFRQLMAVGAADVLVRSAQGKCRTFLMIEQGWPPLHTVVALGTAGDIPLGKLFAVNIFVAIFALCGSGLEVDIDKPGFKIRRLMASDAGGRAVRSQ